jgi:hypothetical protein
MAVTLPYEFDTSGTPKLILRGVLGFLVVVILPGILFSLFVSHHTAAAVQLLLVGLVLLYFGRLFLRNLTASQGTITAQAWRYNPADSMGSGSPVRPEPFPFSDSRPLECNESLGPSEPNRGGTNGCASWARMASPIL